MQLYNSFRIAERMAAETSHREPDVLRSLTLPVAVAVAVVTFAAWYVTWATTDTVMAFFDPMAPAEPMQVALFFVLLVVMMVAMMLPSALPMVVAYHGLTRLEAGRPTRPADTVRTALFASSYFLVWGGFGVVALLGLIAMGILDPMMGSIPLVSAGALLAAGLYQLTRPKEVCLSHCQSPMGFVMHAWRPGRAGALRMGLHHALYCIGCCWLFMIALFVAGAMSLPWMGVISVAIFAEKLGTHPEWTRRGIAAVLVGLSLVLVVQAMW